jgi:hypothetical protein
LVVNNRHACGIFVFVPDGRGESGTVHSDVASITERQAAVWCGSPLPPPEPSSQLINEVLSFWILHEKEKFGRARRWETHDGKTKMVQKGPQKLVVVRW